MKATGEGYYYFSITYNLGMDYSNRRFMVWEVFFPLSRLLSRHPVYARKCDRPLRFHLMETGE